MAGLFVQKHADAVRAQGVGVEVLCSYTWRELFREWRRIRREGLPDIVQLNVIQKQGLLALWLKRRYGIPYVIVEHWSGYLPENGQFMRQSAVKRRFCAYIARHADRLLCVSQCLADAMQACGVTNAHTELVSNVVDDFFFDQSECVRNNPDISEAVRLKTLLYVSCFDERAKNTFALLRGFSVLCSRRSDVRLVMVGTGIDLPASQAMAAQLSIPSDRILWTGEQMPEEVCAWMYRADAFVLTSRYETAGIVLSEAAATGTPILSTPVGIAEELVTSETGIIISQEDANTPERLAEAMEQVLSLPKYSSGGKEYSFSAVGQQLKEIYMQCMISSHAVRS